MKNLLLITGLLTALAPGALFAQELPRPSMARQEDQSHTLPTDYNMKAGPVLFNVTSSLDAEYNDNIGLTNNNTLSDFILTPEVGLNISWPVTEVNTLSLQTSIGYSKYMIHPQYDTSNILVSPTSSLSFDIYTGNLKINFHDNFSFQQDPVDEAALSNVVNFSRFENIAGIGFLWDLNKVVLTLNYDHINFVATDIQTSSGSNVNDPGILDYAADQVSASATVHATSTLITGVEVAASRRYYDRFSGDYDSFTAGPFAQVQITEHVKAEVSGGYAYTGSPNGNSIGANQLAQDGVLQPGSGGGSDSSYYFDLTLDHELNQYYLERLSIGHDLTFDVLATQSEVSYVNYTSSWKVNTHLNIATTIGFQDVSENGGLVDVSSFDYFSAAIQASFPVTPSISGALRYQFNDKFAGASDQSYSQNQVGLNLTYHF